MLCGRNNPLPTSKDATSTSAAPAEQESTTTTASTADEQKPAEGDDQAQEQEGANGTAAEKTEGSTAQENNNNQQQQQQEGDASQPLMNTPPLAEGQVMETVPVADHQVGRLIGKDGGNIRQMESASGAQVNVPGECEPGTTARNITIRGSVESVQYCKQLLEQKVREDGGNPEAPTGDTVTKVTYIPNDHVGRVIGRGGTTIRQIQELSGAHMDIAKECRPGEFQREVTVTGTPAQVQQCEDLIQKKVAGESLPPAPTRSANECVITIPDDMVGR